MSGSVRQDSAHITRHSVSDKKRAYLDAGLHNSEGTPHGEAEGDLSRSFATKAFPDGVHICDCPDGF